MRVEFQHKDILAHFGLLSLLLRWVEFIKQIELEITLQLLSI